MPNGVAVKESTLQQTGAWKQAIPLVIALGLIIFSRSYVTHIEIDWLNFIPALATIYLIFFVLAPQRVLSRSSFVQSAVSDDRSARKSFGSFLFSRWFRSLVLFALLITTVEFGLRCLSFHRSLTYARVGDLLFTPVPNQKYVEKISLSHSEVNNYGLRGADLSPKDFEGKEVILCLGDSITYGYGVDDAHTYPAELQKALDQKYPGHYLVLNAGTNAYPMSFEDQRFLYLWNMGLRPQVVIVGYSMNEGWLGNMVDSDAKTKDAFGQRVKFKNALRSFAFYNLVVENWARNYYNHVKGKFVPGTNRLSLTPEEMDSRYEGYLDRIVGHLKSHNVEPIFLLFAGYNGQTHRYDTLGPFESRFEAFAKSHNIPIMRSEDVLRVGEPANATLENYFIDQAHMNESGTVKVAGALANFLPGAINAENSTAPSNQRSALAAPAGH